MLNVNVSTTQDTLTMASQMNMTDYIDPRVAHIENNNNKIHL